jgi:hypothetical protein
MYVNAEERIWVNSILYWIVLLLLCSAARQGFLIDQGLVGDYKLDPRNYSLPHPPFLRLNCNSFYR